MSTSTPGGGSGAANRAPVPAAMQEKNYEKIVRSYLLQKGYLRTESTFREELSGRHSSGMEDQARRDLTAPPNYVTGHSTATEVAQGAYTEAFDALSQWVHASLDLYKQELVTLLYPLFVHCYLDLLHRGPPFANEAREFMRRFKKDYEEVHPDEVSEFESLGIPEHIKENEFARNWRTNRFNVYLSSFSYELMKEFLHKKNYLILLGLINQYLNIIVFKGQPSETPDSEYHSITGKQDSQVYALNRKPIYWGLFAEQFPKARKEINGEIKKEEKALEPSPLHKSSIPLPKMNDQMEQEYLDDLSKRVALGATSLPSICMYTVFNARDSLNTLEISDDTELVCGGFADSSIRLWDLNKKTSQKHGSHYSRLIGHSGPVYGLSFSPDHRYLLSCSQDKTVRLWNLEAKACVVCYKGHNYPVWDVAFSSLGYYFATVSHDRTARLWTTDHVFPQRIFAGHLSDVNCVQFHPNCNYIATGSTDKTLRLWDVNSGSPVRIFTGHFGSINCLAISPDGKYLASAADDNKIMLWDLASSRKIATYTGHKRTIWSLSFSADSNLLASGSADQTVRLWDCSSGQTKSLLEKYESGQLEPIKSFPTKKTDVYQVKFSRRNLLLAAGVFVAS